MQLLVSVRDGHEAAAALAGGADIIDAKEPGNGPLGPVSAHAFLTIAERVPESVPLSAALGDITGCEEVRAAVACTGVPERRSRIYLKLGFAGERSNQRVAALLSAARESAADAPGAPMVVPVAYADSEAAGAPAPEEVLHSAVEGGADGFLVDTWLKDGRGLLDHVSLERLAALSAAARRAGVMFALAGSLDLAAIGRVAGLADVIGVRGAACRGGRRGMVEAGRVRVLRSRLEELRVVMRVG